MNGYDLQALEAIQKYYLKHGSYPEVIEATPEFLKQMSKTMFSFHEYEQDEESLMHRLETTQQKITTVHVVLIKE